MSAVLSNHFKSRQPSSIRIAQIKFSQRTDSVEAINVAIGNVSLPMHPAMQERMFNLDSASSPFKNGVVKYSATVGLEETNRAFLNILESSGCNTNSLYSQITDGGSQGMELVILGVCGEAGRNEKPLLLIEPAYSNYSSMAERVGRKVVTVSRKLNDQANFVLPDISEVEQVIESTKPGAIVIIPYDNPTGQFYNQEMLVEMCKLAVKHNLWIISDESYRELHYTSSAVSSVWKISEEEVPGIKGRRISLETSSKVWNACGLRIGALITDNLEFHEKSVAENTANLCSNTIGQYIFGALAHESHQSLSEWYSKQRIYYQNIGLNLKEKFRKEMPEVIISTPEASLYSVVDVRNIVRSGFDSLDFVRFCAEKGKVDLNGKFYTLLVAPMSGFYMNQSSAGNTQMRIAYVESQENMDLVPLLFKELLNQYQNFK